MTHLVGIDIGGTFTDVVTLDVESGRLHHAKRPSDPQDLVRGIRQALIDDNVPLDDVAVVRQRYWIAGITAGVGLAALAIGIWQVFLRDGSARAGVSAGHYAFGTFTFR